MKLFIKIKNIKYKLKKVKSKKKIHNENKDNIESLPCEFCVANTDDKLCKKLHKYCKGNNHYFKSY